MPIGGVYASADSPSKYLDRLTTVNTSMNRESNDASPGVEDEPTVSHAVKASHGVILNTVVRNANRLEYSMGNTDDSNVQAVADTTENWLKWTNTVEWMITADGVLRIRPREGDTTGTTGTTLYGSSTVPWYNQRSKIKKVESTGTIVLDENSLYLFYNCSNLTDISGLEHWDVSNVKIMYSMFYGCSSLTDLTALANWNVSNVTSMYSMFYGCSSLTDLTALANWTVSKVTNMGDMFSSCSSLTDLTGLSGWNVSNVTDMSHMFWNCSSLTDLTGLKDWNVSNVTNMSYMFRSCSSLTGLSPLASWDVSNVTNMSYMFSGCSKLIDLTPLECWTVSNVTNMSYMFYGCSSLTDFTPLEHWNVSNVTNMSYMFRSCSSLTDLTPLASWNAPKVTKMSYMFQSCSKLTDLSPLASWDVSNVTNMNAMFCNCSSLTNLTPISGWDVSKVTDMNSMFSGCSSLTELTPIASWNVSKVTSMSYMFDGCSSLTDLTPLTSWNVSNVRNMDSMFSGCSKLTDLTGLASWEVSKVTDMATMFSSCTKLTSLRGLENWNTTSLTRMVNGSWAGGMFYNCTSLSDLSSLANWDVSRVSDMTSMFYDCSSLTNISALAGWKVSNVTDMSFMFYNCSKLIDLTPLERWDVSKVTRMKSVFSSCSSLTNLSPLAHWNVSNVTGMTSMFAGCSNLTDLTGISGWDVSKVTDMNSMFQSCSKLTDLSPLASWDVSNVTNMNAMFCNCSSLTNLTPISGWDVSKVTDMNSMFSGCSSLTELTPIASWNVSKVTSMSYMFDGCSSLTDLTAIASWNVSNVTNMIRMFANCSNLLKVGIPSIANGGQNLVKNASSNKLSDSLGSRIITEDLQLGPYTWDGLYTEMTTNPEGFTEGHVWVRYTPSWIVTYDGHGGVGSQAGSMIPFNESLTLPESQFLRFGYRFIGWTTQSGPVSSGNPLMLPGATYKPDNPVDGEKYPLYAQWEKIGGGEDQPVTGQSGSLPGWVQVDSENTRNDILPNQSQSVTFTNNYDPGRTSIQFRFTQLMDGNVPDSSESFHFELVSVRENKVIQTTVNNGASVQFDPITYDKPDPSEHVYYVRESPSSPQDNVNANPSIDYDDHLVEVKVAVIEADDSSSPSGKKLTATAQITGDTTFRNDSKPASLDITKTVTGVTEGMNDNHKDREFTFNVSLLDRDNQPVSGKTYPTTITNNSESSESSGDASSSTGSITFDNSGNATVKLKAGSKLTINGIPAYYKYVITETNIPAGYDNTSLTNPNGVLGENSHVTVDAVNHYTVTPASVSLQAGKTLLAPGGLNQSVNNGEFQFSLCQVTPLPIGPESGPNVESCAGVSEASNDGNGLVTFPQLTFDTPGTYQYQIREVKGNALDMTYDSTVYTVTVKVTDDGEGRLVAAITYRNNTTGVESSPGSSSVWDPSDPGSMGVPVFVNRTTVANRLPVTGGRDIIIASVILALILSGGLFIAMNRRREE